MQDKNAEKLFHYKYISEIITEISAKFFLVYYYLVLCMNGV